MAGKYEPSAAAAVVGIAAYQLVQVWNNNAPSLAELRSVDYDNSTCRQRLYDADILVGGLATIIGVSFAVLAKDFTALVVMLVIFGSLSLWSHSVLNGESR